MASYTRFVVIVSCLPYCCCTQGLFEQSENDKDEPVRFARIVGSRVGRFEGEKREEQIVIGIGVADSTVVVTELQSYLKLAKAKLLDDTGAQHAPTSTILLSTAGVVALCFDQRIAVAPAEKIPVTFGEQVTILRCDLAFGAVSSSKGIVSDVVGLEDQQQFMIDLSIGHPVEDGLVVNQAGKCIGLVIHRAGERGATWANSIGKIENSIRNTLLDTLNRLEMKELD
jgi:hypothetical protein